MNLRADSETLLSETLEDSDLFGMPVYILAPDGSVNGGSGEPYYGQVNYVSENDDGYTVETPSVVLRISSLDYVPVYGEQYAVRIPESVEEDAELVTYTSNRPPKKNLSLGIITIYLTRLEQNS